MHKHQSNEGTEQEFKSYSVILSFLQISFYFLNASKRQIRDKTTPTIRNHHPYGARYFASKAPIPIPTNNFENTKIKNYL